jgi:DNA invertase Pin-like site-specific DNA recombinase
MFDPFILHLFAALAEKERAMISARTKAALSAARARGVRLGNPRLDEARAKAAAAKRPGDCAQRRRPCPLRLADHLLKSTPSSTSG